MTFLMVLTAIMSPIGALVGIGLIARLIDPDIIGGSGPTGAPIPSTIAGLGALAYAIIGLAFAYGAWTRRPWGWTVGLGVAGQRHLRCRRRAPGVRGPLNAVVQVLIAAALSVYWFRPSVKTAFGRT